MNPYAAGMGGQRERRADAERNIAAILAAALDCFAADANASMAAVATAAGVGRVTLYAHFPSREALLEAVLTHAMGLESAALDAEETELGPADEALTRVIRSSWETIDRCGRLRAAALRALGEERLRRHHDPVLARLERLLERGRAEGVVRTDLPLGWLVTTAYSLMHAAGEEVDAGRLATADAPDVLAATILRALAPA